MYNIRRKLWILTVLLFVVATVMLKVSPGKQAEENIATASNPVQAQVTQTGVFADSGEKFVAHRGYSNYAPENSIPAFEFAGKMGFWGIETDISQTADGQFICMHDEEIDRTTDGSGIVGEMTMDMINQFKIDKGNYIRKCENTKIPTLAEYLEICKQYNCVAVVELKYVSDFDALLGVIVGSGMESRCIIAGSLDDVKEVRFRNNVIPVMTLGYAPTPYTDNLAQIAEIPENRGVLFNFPQVDKEAIDIIHQQGVYCGVWSVDDAQLAQEYASYGADFIITNEIPARIGEQMINDKE